MRAFVTGGSGFVGRHLIAMLCARGDTVRALARSEAAAAAVRDAGAEPVRGDLDDERGLAAGMKGCNVIVHAAALVRDWGRRADFFRVNVDGTERALEAARRAGVGRFVHIGTEAALLGGPPLLDVDETRPLPERSVGLYPLTKKLAEQRVLAANGSALTTVVVRPRFVWGKGDTTLLPLLVQACRKNRFAWLDGGRYRTSTCHVKNVAHGALLAAERGRAGAVYFLTDGPPIEFRAFITAMLRTQGIEPSARSLPGWLARLIAAGGEAAWRVLPLGGQPPLTRSALMLVGAEVTVRDDLARRELGYREVITREQGLAEMAAARGERPDASRPAG